MIVLARPKRLLIAYSILMVMILIGAVVVWFIPKDLPVSGTVMNNEELRNLINNIFNVRNEAILHADLNTIRDFYDTSVRNGLYAYEHEAKKVNYLANWSEKQGVQFNKIQSTVIVKWSRVHGSGYIVNLLVSTAYTYAYRDRPEELNTMRIGTYHEIELSHRNEAFVITREWYTDPFADSLDLLKLKTDDIAAMIFGSEARDLSNLSTRRLKALAYADQYVGAADSGEFGYSYNKKYKNYNSVGGDCANFVSQVLYEGGGFKKSGSWTYQKDGSMAWVKAQNLKDYLVYSGRASLLAYGTYSKVLNLSYKLLPGDIVAYEVKGKVSHVSVVTGVDSRGYTLVNCHNTDRYRVPWDLGFSNTGIKFYFLRVHY